MRKQDHLLGLINSLNANEKRHFRLFAAQQQDETNYLKLFDALEGKEQYNAAELSSTLGIRTAQLHNQKNYLAKILLKSLRSYKTELSLNTHIATSITEIEELKNRGLHDYAIELADKALAYADERDYQYLTAAIIYLKLDILILTGRFDEVPALEEKMKTVQASINEQHAVHSLMAHVTQFQRSRHASEEFLYHNHPLLRKKPEDIKSKRALMGWFIMMNNYVATAQKSSGKVLPLVRKQVAIYESINMKEFSAYHYIAAYSWLAGVEQEAGNNEKAWQATEKLIELVPELRKKISQATIDMTFEFVNLTRIQIAFNTGRYEEGLAMSKKIDAQNRLNDYMRFSFIFDLAKGLLHTNHSAEAIDALQELLQIDNEHRKELQPYIRPLLILAQFGLGNYQVVPYLVRTTRAWMKRSKMNHAGVDLFLSHAYSIAKAPVLKRKHEWAKLLDASEKDSLKTMEKELHMNRWIKDYVL